MANPYSAPSRFTYTPLPLDKLAEVLGKKQEKFDAAQAAGADALAKLNFKSGLIVNEDIVNARENEYREKLKTVSANLLKHKNPAQFNQELSTVLGEMNNDKLLADAELDAQMMPKLLEARNLYGDEGWYKWEKDGKVIDYNTDVVSAGKDISSFYQSMQGADYLAEMELASKVPPQEIQKVADAVYDPRMGKWISKTTNTEIRDLSEDSLAWLDFTQRAYESGSTLSAKSDKLKGLTADQYRKNTLDHIGIFGVNNYKENVAFIDDGESNGRGKSGGGGEVVLFSADYTITRGAPGVVGMIEYEKNNPYAASAKLKSKQKELEQSIALGKTDDIDKLKNDVAVLEYTASIEQDALDTYYQSSEWKALEKNRNEVLLKQEGWNAEGIKDFENRGAKILESFESNLKDAKETILLAKERPSFIKKPEGEEEKVKAAEKIVFELENSQDFKNLKYQKEVMDNYYSNNIAPSLNKFVEDNLKNKQVTEIQSYNINWGQGVAATYADNVALNFNLANKESLFDYDQSQVYNKNANGLDRNKNINTIEMSALLETAFTNKLITPEGIGIETSPEGVFITASINGKVNDNGTITANSSATTKTPTISTSVTKMRMKVNEGVNFDPNKPNAIFNIVKSFEQIQSTDQKTSDKYSNMYGQGFVDYVGNSIKPIKSGGSSFNLKNDFLSKSQKHGGVSPMLKDSEFISLQPVNQNYNTTLGHILYKGSDKDNKQAVTLSDIYAESTKSESAEGNTKVDLSMGAVTPKEVALKGLISSVINSYLESDDKSLGSVEERATVIDSLVSKPISFNELVAGLSSNSPNFTNNPFVFDNKELVYAFSFNKYNVGK